MKTRTLKKISQRLRAAAPYVLIELLLPGGTLVAVLLWLSQHKWAETPQSPPLAAAIAVQAKMRGVLLGFAPARQS